MSLRDVERVLSVMAWFYRHRRMLFPMMDRLAVQQIQHRQPRGAEEEMEYEVRGHHYGNSDIVML